MALMAGFRSRWEGLESRDQTILRYSAVVVGLLLFYLFVVDPINSGRDTAEQRLRSAQEALSVAQRQAFDLKASQTDPKAAESGSLLTEVESSTQQEGLRTALKRLQPSGDNQIQVSLEGASYEQLMRWLASTGHPGATGGYSAGSPIESSRRAAAACPLSRSGTIPL